MKCICCQCMSTICILWFILTRIDFFYIFHIRCVNHWISGWFKFSFLLFEDYTHLSCPSPLKLFRGAKRYFPIAPPPNKMSSWALAWYDRPPNPDKASGMRRYNRRREGVQRRHDPRKNDLRASGFAELPPGPAKLVSRPQWCHQASRHSVSTPRILAPIKKYLSFISAKNLFFLIFNMIK